MQPRVKICGITTAEQARWAAEAGADAIGLVFHEPSTRAVGIQQATDIIAAIPAYVSVVGLFMNPDAAQVRTVLERLPLEMLQFHGEESADFCRRFGRRYVKAVGMSGELDLEQASQLYPDAAALLVDSHAGRRAGGTGERFDWSRLPSRPDFDLVLAGGLAPGNVAEAIRVVRPWAVDVSSGVESAPGQKDPQLMSRFIEEVQGVGQSKESE
ncbi:phosphoribosylanthranilate isomerase [Gammaproteobacteria bacterium AB-CW1]|uniref:N-(5'-phosphoribosyl)anthranilate isomerase n=1 Tax=Natronospira elongata TaxID=3110268 RepID=A0AAP6JDK1_9GAMM|nr:phosphoribosylanthranilate isomerase [Gammaproteobacteria bacterium AB-CW1]